ALRPFLQGPYAETSGVFSPDGRWLAYASDESGRFEVYVQPFPGPGAKLQVSTAAGVQPRWRGDGRELFYREPSGRFMAVPVTVVIADEFPQIEAVVTPPASTARFYFKGAGDSQYYFVLMSPKVGRFVAVLPKPKPKAGPLTYYIAVVGPDGAKARTPELDADVVQTAESCPNPKAVAEAGAARDVEVLTEAACL